MGGALEKRRVGMLMSLTMFVTLQMMVGVVSAGIFSQTKITITNKLSEAVTIHCRDKLYDDGVHILQPTAGHRFQFFKNPFKKKTLWYCSFEWTGRRETFDIYDQRRDKCADYRCSWLITEAGPCQVFDDYYNPTCSPWDPHSSLQALQDGNTNV